MTMKTKALKIPPNGGSKPNPSNLILGINPEDSSMNLIPGPVGVWFVPATITPNNFQYKSLSNWALNIAVGCGHGCIVCYVPSTSTNKQAPQLTRYNVTDPDAEWGDYVLVRPWDEKKFLASLRAAEQTPVAKLKPDGNRAVIYSSTTDPYQVVTHPDAAIQKLLNEHLGRMVRRSLELIRDHSTLNVRILTRSPQARKDFDLYSSFGHRLLFGMSLPTLRNDLSRIYEPFAPAPSQRLAALRAARDAGLNIFVAMAPTYPECDSKDLEATLRAVAALDPVTVFHEPINVRAENIARIQKAAAAAGVKLNTGVFSSKATWARYALDSLHTVEGLASQVGLADRLHPWPDSSLESRSVCEQLSNPNEHLKWLNTCWSRVSAWPGKI
jgi:DNA repair photolyase